MSSYVCFSKKFILTFINDYIPVTGDPEVAPVDIEDVAEISFVLPDGWQNSDYAIYYLDNGEWKELPDTRIENSRIYGYVDFFATFIMVEKTP